MLGKTNSAGSTPNLIEKNIFDNGTYIATDDNADGYSQVTVALPLGEKSIISNGEYLASADDLKGFSKVKVNVPAPALGTKNITANGTYNAGSDNLDGYSQVIVNVPSPTLYTPLWETITDGQPPRANINNHNGLFPNGVVYTVGGNTFAVDVDTSVVGVGAKIFTWEIFEHLPLAGGSVTIQAQVTGANFNISNAVSDTYSWPTATETSGYMSVSGLGDSSPIAQTYTYDSNFPRSFPTVQDTYGNEFIRIPTIYRSVTVTNGQITGYKLSLTKIDSTYEPYPCFIDETNSNAILPYILIGKWCISSSSTANSVNATPAAISIGNARTLCRARGTGYQQYDWKMHQLFIDLGVALSRTVNINQGWRVNDIMGIENQNKSIWIDGIIKGSSDYATAWYFADKESDYYSPTGTTETEADILLHGYHKLSYSSPSSSGGIMKLGYDSSHKFENYPNEIGGSNTTYYCDYYQYGSGSRPVDCKLGQGLASYGWWYCETLFVWAENASARLCYRPTLGATGYVETVIDPVLANNSWDTIKQVCQSGDAPNYWSLGDTKDISLTISGTPTNIPHAIVDLTLSRYEYTSDSTKHSNVVFQAVPTIGDHMFNSSSNTSPNGDTAYNGWDYSQLRAKLQTGGAIFNSYDSTFTALLEQVKTMAAYSGKTNTLVYSNDLLFVPAAREVKANYTSVQSCEVNSEQTQYGYYYDNGNDGNANRIKYPYNSQSATYWWLRSPYADFTNGVRYVYSGGNMNYDGANIYRGVAPCFAW